MQVTKIKCPLCGQEISKSNYSKHQRRHQNHPETFNKSLVSVHDGLNCRFCGKECINKNSLVQHELRCSSNPNRINTVIDNFNNIGHKSWNRGLTKETDSRVMQGAERMKEGYKSGRILRKIGYDNVSKRPEVRQKISNTCKEKAKRGEWHTSLAKDKHIDYNGTDLHCSWELRYAVYLDSLNISWVRCKERFPYKYEDVVHYYTPNFYLPQTNEYIEIKGYSTEKDYAKWEQFPKDKKLTILQKDDLSRLGIDTK